MTKKLLASIALGALVSSMVPLTSAQAANSAYLLTTSGVTNITPVGLGENDIRINAISADGLTAIGSVYVNGASGSHGAYWHNGTWVDIGALRLGGYTDALAVSADGSVIVGESSTDTGYHVFRWTSSDMTMHDLGTLGGDNGTAYGVSADGSVVVGRSSITGNTEDHAFRWTESDMTMHDLGTLGGTYSLAYAVSADGNVVVGESNIVGDAENHAFRWTESDMTMHDLGTLGGTSSTAYGVSADGSIVVGNSYIASNSYVHAFSWSGSSMTDLGTLGAGETSYARAISADGHIIVGSSTYEAGGWDYAAVRWVDGVIEDMNEVAADAGVSMVGIFLTDTLSVSNDGDTYIVKVGDDSAILKLAGGGSGGGSGLITVDDLLSSMAGSSLVAVQGDSSVTQGIGYSMFQARQATSSFSSFVSSMGNSGMTGVSAGANYLPGRRIAAYATGTFGIGQNDDSDNNAINGAAGLMFRVGENGMIGGGIIGSSSRVNTPLGGSSDLSSLGGSLIASYEGESGLRLYGTAAAAWLETETDRHYMNGSAVDASQGNSSGIGYGGAVRAGWNFALSDAKALTPFGEVEYAHTTIDGYTEGGGAFAASYSDHTVDQWVSRLGAQVDQRLNETVSVGMHAAWVHRLKGDGGTFTASSSGFTLPLTGQIGDRDWAQGGVSGTFKLSTATTLNADITARTGKIQESRIQGTLGITAAF